MNKINFKHIDLNLLLTFEVLMLERNVSRAALVLGRTQSAISHALSRLRVQLADPLLIKTGGAMRPTDIAIELIEQVRPILSSLQRVLNTREAFEPAVAEHVFRFAAPDFALTFFPKLLSELWKEAPFVCIDWMLPMENLMLKIIEGQIDLAIVPADQHMPNGISKFVLGGLEWQTYARRGHPAFDSWDLNEWTKWPHVVVRTPDRLPSPVKIASTAVDRRVGAWVPSLSAVAPLLEHTDLLATLPTSVMAEAVSRFNLDTRPSPISISPMRQALIWSARKDADPAIVWLRKYFKEALDGFCYQGRIIDLAGK